ncbi:MAG: ABC transporter ATP-binding protein [Oscillospiraceae bacterium]
MNALSIAGLRKEYGKFCLDGLDLELPQGCILGLIGENGAGKSTTIKAVLRLIRPDGGTIKIFGKPVTEETMEDVGVVLDEGCLPEKVTCTELGKLMRKFYKNWDDARFSELMAQFALEPDKKFKELSRGMKMKISLAIAMSHKARLLILDEATSGLDVVARDEVLDMLLAFISNGENSVLISSHIVTDLEKICDYICFIHRGKRLFLEEKDVLLEKYGIVRCTKADFAKIPPEDIIGSRVTDFGAEALLERSRLPHGLMAERAGIEDIILFYVKGERQ